MATTTTTTTTGRVRHIGFRAYRLAEAIAATQAHADFHRSAAELARASRWLADEVERHEAQALELEGSVEDLRDEAVSAGLGQSVMFVLETGLDRFSRSQAGYVLI